MIFYRAVAWLPFPVLYLFAWLGYLLLYYVTGYRKTVVTQNLSNAFPDKSEREITVLAKKFYRQLAQVAFEILKSRRMAPEDFKVRCRVVNPELIQRLSKDSSESLIVLTIHQGNWEWMLHGAAMGLDAPVDAVFKPLHNKTADQLIHEIRTQFGSRPFPIADSAKNILRRRKEFRLLVMVADQSPIRSERSHWMQFMNQPAAFYLGAETIAKMTKFPVVFAQCHRRSTGYYEIEFHELATPPYEKQSHEITERFVEFAEMAIINEPESWLWSNRRWKRDPIAEAALADPPSE
ncbi:MAG: lysophospholipid acyltransferase family protein [Halioglobus sp.]